ncbi:DUF6531 domain-containing protein, partial [Brenneria alni]|uniref:DUF6531 domain-containing protein n=1 Tax=Brenneria alni TaxID=71656 RepID=UPI001F0CA111
MNQDKQAALMTSGEAAAKNFSTDNKISGGCSACGCEVIIRYHYDSGRPVPNAPFVLTDSNGAEIHGKTDANGLCHIVDMGCGAFELLLDEGTDVFEPKQTVQNNPVLQSSPAYAALGAEYFTLYLRLRKQGLLTYDAEDSGDSHVEVEGAGIFRLIPDEYRKEYDRFWQLNEQINRGSRQLKQAINKTHHSLAAEVADMSEDDNAAFMMLCQVVLGCVPVVGQALDLFFIGEWCWKTYENPALLDDNLHLADGALCVIGVVPGLGDAIKVVGRAILKALKKGSPDAVQFAIKTIRSLSDGNLVQGVTRLRGLLREYGKKGKDKLADIRAAMIKALDDAAKDNWLIGVMKQRFGKMIDNLDRLIEGYDEAITTLESQFGSFIPLIVTRASGSALSKGAFAKSVKAPAPRATAGTRAASQTPAPVPKKTGAPEKVTKVNAGRSQDTQPGAAEQQKKAGERDQANCANSGNCRSEGEPVDMATGYVVDWRTDFQLSGVLPLLLKRYYRSGGERRPGLLGSLWRCNWDMDLTLDHGVAT